MLLQEPVIIEVKGLRVGFLGYCYIELVYNTDNCEEVRRRYSAGPAIYRYDIAARDIKNLKVRILDYKSKSRERIASVIKSLFS